MSQERLIQQGHLLTRQNERAQIEVRIRGLVAAIRAALDPFGHIADLQADVAAQACLELATLRIRWNELGHEIEAIRRALGTD